MKRDQLKTDLGRQAWGALHEADQVFFEKRGLVRVVPWGSEGSEAAFPDICPKGNTEECPSCVTCAGGGMCLGVKGWVQIDGETYVRCGYWRARG